MKTKILAPTEANIALCAAHLKKGGLVAFPTETVYGLGANALDESSVRKIYEAKGRPSDNPLIVHLGEKGQIDDYAEVSPDARLLIDRLVPGALTILLKKKPIIPDIVTGGRDTVGIRIPSNEIGAKFLRACNVPVCAPSANTSTRPSPTIAQHVFDDLYGRVRFVLDGGGCDIGIESTIIDLSNDQPTILRKGKITKETIERILGKEVLVSDSSEIALSPGLKYKHYSPKARVIMVRSHIDITDTINQIYKNELSSGKKAAIICYNRNKERYPGGAAIGAGSDANDYAQSFYGLLRQLDKDGVDVIILEAPEEEGIGLALYNRMQKSAGGTIVDGNKDMQTLLDQARVEQAAREQTTREQAVREQTVREQAAKEQAGDKKLASQVRKVVFVCTGNTCRSPMAERILNHKLKELGEGGSIKASSRGLMANGSGMNFNAISALNKLGIDCPDHTSRLFETTLLEEAFVVVCMEERHKNIIFSEVGKRDNVKTANEITGSGDIPDPYGGNFETYLDTAKKLDELCLKVIEYLGI